jgi:NAD(P)H-dependent flavin oxidoreductase YrpB (nitropropane dioxygenase family)
MHGRRSNARWGSVLADECGVCTVREAAKILIAPHLGVSGSTVEMLPHLSDRHITAAVSDDAAARMTAAGG